MIRTSTSATVFASVWFVLATWQSVRGYTRCEDESGWAALYWALLAALLVVPLVVVRLVVAEGEAQGSRSFDAALGLALLTYIPVTIAMRLLEICATVTPH